MSDRDAFMRMMGITQEDVLDPAEKIKSFPLEKGIASVGAAVTATREEGSREGWNKFSSLTASSSFPKSSPLLREREYSFGNSPERGGSTVPTTYPGASASPSSTPHLSASPSQFHSASEALAGARQAVKKMTQEQTFCVYSPFGDRSAEQRLRAPPPTSTFSTASPPSFSGGTGNRLFTDCQSKGNWSASTPPAVPPQAAMSNACHHRHTLGASLGKEQPTSSSPSPQEKIRRAEECKVMGNDAFEKGEFLKAIHHYSRGIEILEESSRMKAKLRSGGLSEEAIHFHTDGGKTGDQEKFQSLLFGTSGGTEEEETILLAALYSNRSASYLQGSKWVDAGVESAYDHSLFDADRAVSLRPQWFKGYSRQGDGYFKMQRYHQAVESYAMASSLDPGNTRLMHSLAEAKERAKAGSREEWRARRARRSRTSDTASANALSASSPMEEGSGVGDGGGGTRRRGNESEPNSCVESTNGSLLMSSTYSSIGTSMHQDAHATDGLPYSRRHNNNTSSNNYNISPNSTSGTIKGEQARGLWENFKKEVEQTSQAATGDGYRQAQLEKYRMQRSGGGGRGESASSFSSSTLTGGSSSTPSVWSSGPSHPLGRAGGANIRKSLEDCHSSSSEFPPLMSLSGSDKLNSSHIAGNGGGLSSIHVPPEYSTAAAASYQQKLLESFRQKRKPL